MDSRFFDFSQEFESVAWLHSLPSGMLTEKIDTRYHSVYITPLEDGCTVYVGPKNPDSGGEALTVTLDNHWQLVDFVIERIAPIPVQP